MAFVAFLAIAGGVLLIYAGLTGQNIVKELQRILGGDAGKPAAAS